jgi:tetratricopeptide (TPR) repeat protein
VLALVAPFVIAFLVARPPQGVVRDWDSFAVPGAAFSVAAAWAVARALSAPSATWLAIPVALAVSMPAVQWLAHYADLPRAMARIEALLEGPPVRSADERSRLWDMVGMKRLAMGDAPASAHAFEKAAEAAPSPRLLTQWGMAEAMAGRHDRALASYRRAVERDSSYVTAWIGIGVSGLNAGDLESASRAVAMLERLAPGNPKTREIADALRARSSSP